MKQNWVSCSFGEVATLQRGFDLPTSERKTGIYPIVSSSGEIDHHSEGPVVAPGVVTGRSGSIGKVFYLQHDFWPLNTTLFVKDFHGNLPRYVYYLLLSLKLSDHAGGTGVPTLNRNDIHKLQIKRAPLKEQQRIVEILDSAFAGIERAKEIAHSGIAMQDQILEAHAQSHYKGPWRKLDELLDFKNGINFDSNQKGSLGIPTIDVLNMYSDSLEVDLRALYRVDKPMKQDYFLSAGDVLIVRSSVKRQGVAWPTIFAGSEEPVTFCGFIIRGRPLVPLDSRYVVNYLRLPSSRDAIVRESKQSTITNVSQEILSRFEIPFPDLKEQRKLADSVAILRSKVLDLKRVQKTKLMALDELRNSLLQKAFSGDL